MIICISGLTGSGKTTVGKLIAKELGIKHIDRSFKEFATGRALIAFDRSAKPSFDRAFDREVIKEARAADSVVTTWLGPWMIKGAALNVWLGAGLDTRVRRIASANRLTLREAKSYTRAKDGAVVARIRKAYGIDILKDHNVFDLEVNTERLHPKQTAALVAMLAVEKGGKRFR
jgi:predicted cytidylate kinase